MADERQRDLILQLRACSSPKQRLDVFLEVCRVHSTRDTFDHEAEDRWVALDTELTNEVLLGIDNDIRQHLGTKKRDGRRKPRKAPANAHSNSESRSPLPKGPTPDVVTRLSTLTSATQWKLRPHQILRDFGTLSVFKSHTLRQLKKIEEDVKDSDGAAVPWYKLVMAVHSEAEKRRDGRNHGPGLSKSKHFQLNDITAARDQILASNEYRTRDDEGPKATSKTDPEARGRARKKRKIGQTDTNPNKQPCLSPVDEDEQVSVGKRDGGVEEDGKGRQDDSLTHHGHMGRLGESTMEPHNPPMVKGEDDILLSDMPHEEDKPQDARQSVVDHSHSHPGLCDTFDSDTDTSSDDFASQVSVRSTANIVAEGGFHTLEDSSGMPVECARGGPSPCEDAEKSTFMNQTVTPSPLPAEWSAKASPKLHIAPEDPEEQDTQVLEMSAATPDDTTFLLSSPSRSFQEGPTSNMSKQRRARSMFAPGALSANSSSYSHRGDAQPAAIVDALPNNVSKAMYHDAERRMQTEPRLTNATPQSVASRALPARSLTSTLWSAQLVTRDSVSNLLQVPNVAAHKVVTSDSHGILKSIEPGEWLSASAVAGAIEAFNPDPTCHRVFESPYLELQLPTDDANDSKAQRDQRRTQTKFYHVINLRDVHWILAMMDRVSAELEVYDPSPTTLALGYSRVQRVFRRYALQVGSSSSTASQNWTTKASPLLAQRNSYDCGIYVAVRAIVQMHGRPCPPSIIPELWRRAFALWFSSVDELPQQELFSPRWVISRLMNQLDLHEIIDAHSTTEIVKYHRMSQSLLLLRDEILAIVKFIPTAHDIDGLRTKREIREALDWHRECKRSCPATIQSTYLTREAADLDQKIRTLSRSLKWVSCRDILEADADSYDKAADEYEEKATDALEAVAKRLQEELLKVTSLQEIMQKKSHGR